MLLKSRSQRRLLPGAAISHHPRAPRYPCLSPPGHPSLLALFFVAVFFPFLAPPVVPRPPFCSVLFPRRPLALCRTPS